MPFYNKYKRICNGRVPLPAQKVATASRRRMGVLPRERHGRIPLLRERYGRVALQCDRLRVAQSIIDVIAARLPNMF